MSKFNLTFSGEILTGMDPADVKRLFGKMFAIDDPERIERFFSGQTVILRRNLERKDAAQYFHKLHLLGAVAALVKVGAEDEDGTETPSEPPSGNTSGKTVEATKPSDAPVKKKVLPAQTLDASSQVWAVSSSGAVRQPDSGEGNTSRKGGRKPSSLDVSARVKAKKKRASEDANRAAEEEKARTEKQDQLAAAEQADLKEAKRKQKEETAKQDAARERKKAERAKQRAEEDARRRGEREEKERKQAEKTARLKADREEKKRKAAEEAARRKTDAEEKKRKADENAARRKAEEDRKRKADEIAAREKAEAEEKKRRADEKAARRKAEKEKKRKAAEEAAQRKAEEEEKKRREAEKAARRKAQEEEKKRRAAEEAARRKAQEEEKKRRAAEEAAQRKAQEEEKKRRKAKEAAQRKAQEEERKRREAEEAAQRKAQEEEKKRREAEEAARRKAQEEEKKRREAEEAARRKAQEEEEKKRREAGEVSRLEAELAAIEQEEAAEIQLIRAETQRKRAVAERESTTRLRAIQANEPTQETLPLGETTTTTAAPVIGRTSNKPLVKTTAGDGSSPPQRKRQQGEPNLFKLRPFRNTEEVRNRSTRAALSRRRYYRYGAAALLLLLIAGSQFLLRTPDPVITGSGAVAISGDGGPVLLVGPQLLFHDRAGVATRTMPLSDLGLASLEAPLAFDNTGALIGPGIMEGDNATAPGNTPSPLLRCDVEQSRCEPLAPVLESGDILALAVNRLDDTILTAIDSQLVKLGGDGEILARATVDLPEHPSLRLHAGLLFVNSPEGPAIRVYRYEDSAFANQLDEVLLLPPTAVKQGLNRVGDFIWSAEAWWVNLYNADTGDGGLYRFDEEWNFLGESGLPDNTDFAAAALTRWGQKTLVNTHRPDLLRFSGKGEIELPFVSSRMTELISMGEQKIKLEGTTWRLGLLLLAAFSLVGIGAGFLQHLRQLVYKGHRERGAEPIDEYASQLQWVNPAPSRPGQLRQRTLSYYLLVFAILLVAIAQSVDVWQMAALLVFLSGPGVALSLLSRHSIGHIGRLRDRLILVDHSGMYHIAGDSSVQYRGPFLAIDDVLVYCGNHLIPAFDPRQVAAEITPLAKGGVKVDRKTILVKLLQSRHPLALGGLAVAASTTLAVLLLALAGMFQI